MNRGRLIAFEGLDGCGKSTQSELLAVSLRGAGRDVLVTREPTDGEFGRRIRALARSGEAIAPREELRWFVEDRRHHVRDVIDPGLAAGKIVVTDRYFLSSVAYQGARGCDAARILDESEAEFPHPDLAVLLEIEPALGLERVRRRGTAMETHFERAEFLAAVAEIFRSLDRPYIRRFDASVPADALSRAILESIATLLG